MNLKTALLENPKLTYVLLLIIVAFNLLFTLCWFMHHHRQNYHYRGAMFFQRGFGRGFQSYNARFSHEHQGFGHRNGFDNFGRHSYRGKHHA